MARGMGWEGTGTEGKRDGALGGKWHEAATHTVGEGIDAASEGRKELEPA